MQTLETSVSTKPWGKLMKLFLILLSLVMVMGVGYGENPPIPQHMPPEENVTEGADITLPSTTSKDLYTLPYCPSPEWEINSLPVEEVTQVIELRVHSDGLVTFHPNIVRESDEEIIRRLAQEGKICEVFGHSWRPGRPGEGEGDPSGLGTWYADLHPGRIYRTCRICGKCEAQSLEWK